MITPSITKAHRVFLEQVKAKQQKAGPGVRLVPFRRYGINCRTLITPGLIRQCEKADGTLAWTPLQTFAIHSRNDPRLAEMNIHEQAAAVSAWYRRAPSVKCLDLWHQYNDEYKSTMKLLRDEEQVRRELNLQTTFIGSHARFLPSYRNFCAYYYHSGQAFGDLGSRPPRPFRTDKHKAAPPSSRKLKAPLTKREWRLRARRSTVYFDLTTLKMYDVARSDIESLTFTDLTQWTHRALFTFSQLSDADRRLFQIADGEHQLWRNPNAKHALFMRFLQRRSRSSDFRAQKLEGAAIYAALIREYRSASPELLARYLDDSHRTQFPLFEGARARW